MKTLHFLILVVCLFILALVVSDQGFGDRMKWMSALDWTVTALGSVISIVSAFWLLQNALRGAKLPQMLPVVLALFGGLSLFQRYWAVPVAFAFVTVCWLTVEYLRPPDRKSEERGSQPPAP